ncbi:MAG: type I-D CRISPR-associated protein Cas5/Csc1 [Fimbriimonadia bacterium]|nr:type I-D CRISPR-associated protein Cas5/Csc1 [Fimbriimonadia bacterium]
MAQSLDLNKHGTRLYLGRLYNHDYLWFSSNEISKVSLTQPFLHNYALCYALSQRSHRLGESSPKYVTDPEGEFGSMPLYPTPAQANNTQKTTVTFNALDSLTCTTGDSKRMNTPNLGKRVYLNLQWEPIQSQRPEKGYEFFVFTFNDYRLPGAFRLGKKGTPIRMRWEEIPTPHAWFRNVPTRPSHIINPADVSGSILSYEPIAIPPHLLLKMTTLQDDWFVHSGNHMIHVPKRVLERIGIYP